MVRPTSPPYEGQVIRKDLVPYDQRLQVLIWASEPNQSGRTPEVVALFSAASFSSNIIELLQLHDTIKITWNYA